MSVAGKSEGGGSSLGSGKSGGKHTLDNIINDDAPNNTMENGLFGVLFTVSKEKAPGNFFVGFRLFMDWIQVFLLVVNPAYGWNIDSDNRAWQIFNFIQLNTFMSARGYMFFLVCMYILAGALALNLGLCVWVSHSFKTNNFEHVWPIVILRFFSLVFYQVLDIASLTLFLMTMDCQYFSVPDSQLGHHAEFPSIMCWTMPHMIHVGVAALSVVVFYMLATLFTMAEIELNPLSHNPLGMANTKAEVYAFTVKTIMTCVSVLVNGLKWMAAAQLLGAVLLVYLYLRWLPHLRNVVNYIRVGCFSSVLWAAFLLVLMVLQLGVDPDDKDAVTNQRKAYTAALWAGFVPMAFIGAGAAYLRTQHYVVTVANKFRDAPLDMKPTHIHEFEDPRLVELTSRCCRVWVARDVLDEERVQVAERVIRAGMSMLHDPYMAIWWSSFLIDVRGSYQSGFVALQAAKKMPNASFLERFCIFIREQEHTQKASAASSGDNASADLVSYVEFQRNYRLVLRLHMEALGAKKLFWETLLNSQVSFTELSRVVAKMDTTVRQSERMYAQVLQRHSNSVKLLVLYVKFLKFVKNDPWSAARWGTEAEKLQTAEEEANEKAVLGEGEGDKRKTEGFDESKAIVIIHANALIRMVNDSAVSMLGYQTKAELVGKNVNIIVPPPFSRNHNNYVRNYIETGVPHVLDNVVTTVAMHKDHYVVPIKLLITKVSGIGEDSVFMGLLQQLPSDSDTATAWLMATGHILSCDGVFTDWLGYKQDDLHMKPFRELAIAPVAVDELLAQAKKGHAAKLRRPSALEPTATGALSPLLSHTSEAGEARATRASDMGEKYRGSHDGMLPLPVRGDSIASPDHHHNNHMPPRLQPYMTKTLDIKHSFMDDKVTMDVRLEISGVLNVPLLVVKMQRPVVCDQNMKYLMVVDEKGKINHATSMLAKRLGTTTSKLQGAGMTHALDNLIPAPFVKLHQNLSKTAMSAEVPPWSCRSGLSVPLNGMGPEGPCIVGFGMTMKQKVVAGTERTTIVQLEEKTGEQMSDERRLSLIVNSKGMVVTVSPSPDSLFNMDPQALVGCPVAHILDILRAPVELAATQDVSALLDHEEQAVKLLHQMAQKSYDNPGMSWRVGVSAIIDPLALVALGPMGQAMLAKETIPAVMVVQPYMDKSVREGARAVVAKELQYHVELWRTDMISGVLEVDANGVAVQNAFVKSQPVYSPHLLLGLPPSLILGTSLPALIASNKNPTALVDGLFVETGVTGRPSTAIATAPRGPKSGMRGTSRSKRDVGPVHTVKLRHGTDGLDLEVHVQAVIKHDQGTTCSLYVILHAVRPKCGRPDFGTWLRTSPDPVRPRVGDTPTHAPVRTNSKHDVSASPRGAPFASGQPQAPRKKAVSMFHDAPTNIPGLLPGVLALTSTTEAGESFRAGSIRPGGAESMRRKASVAPKVSDDGSTKGPLDKEDNDRISNWILATTVDQDAAGDLDEEDIQDHEDSSSEDEDRGPQPVHAVPEGSETAVEELDEAGTSMNDFKRGKRLKKLIKLLDSPQAVTAVKRFKTVALAVVAVLVIVDLVMFVVFYGLINTQVNQVISLRQAARAGSRVMQIAQLSSSIELLVSSHFPPDNNMKFLGMGKLEDDIQANIDLMVTRIKDLEYLHHGIYRGFDSSRQLPDQYGLRQLWDQPSLPSRSYFLSRNDTLSVLVPDSLWNVGNLYLQNANAIVHNVQETYPVDDQVQRYKFANDTSLLYLLFNGPNCLVDAYATTLDSLMQLAVNDASRVNNIQLIILGVEGAFVAVIAFLIMCWVTRKVMRQRFKVFNVFIKVPQGIIKAEATRAQNLVEGDEEEDDDVEGGDKETLGAGGGQDTEAGLRGTDGGANKRFSPLGMGTAKFALGSKDAMETDAQLASRGFLTRTMTFFASLRVSTATQSHDSTKRTVQQSQWAVLNLAWPFLFWALFVILINALGWKSLANVKQPIAVSNIVQFVSIRANKVVFLSQRFVSQQYLNDKYGYTTEPDYLGNPEMERLKGVNRQSLQAELQKFLREYEAMMYGNAAPSVANDTSPHFQLATKGILFDPAASFIFQYSGCLAENATDCKGPESDMYPYLTAGLDQAIKYLVYSVNALLLLPNDQVNMACLPFDFIYEAGSRDIVGSLEVLIDVYSNHVRAVYQQALTLHIAALAVCCVLGLGFIFVILLPTCKVVANERRRVAELLSHLPPEVDVEGMVAQALGKPPLLASASVSKR